MVRSRQLMLSLFCFCLLSCDGPNTTTETGVANRGLHNEDGFQVSFKINNGASITSELLVALQFSAIGADEIYITQESACNIGGAWESYKSFKQWTLQKPNDINFFYLKVRSGSRTSDCHFASIEHDATAPVFQLVAPVNNSTLLSPNQLSLDGTCSEDSVMTIVINGVIVATASCTAGVWAKVIDVSVLPFGAISVELKATDLVNNTASVQNFMFTK